MNSCPSCKKKVSSSAKECPNCGLMIPTENHAKTFRTRTISIAIAIIIVATLAVYALFRVRENDKPLTPDSSEIVHAETLKDMDGEEFTPNDIVAKFNSFMREAEADSLSIVELVLEPGKSENIYRDTKNNDSISIFMTTSKERTTVTSVSVLAQSKNEEPTEFITYCFALMSIFTPTMQTDVRRRVLFSMMGYTESGDVPLSEENTYIIIKTKYIFTYSKQKGLSMLIEQMPKLELYSGDRPVF